MTLTEAKRVAGSLSYPSKMPGTAYDLPAAACITGTKLAIIKGSACSKCYALRDRYTWVNPQKAQHYRLAAITHPQWVDAMVTLLLHIHRKPKFKIDLGVKDAKARGLVRTRWNVAGWHRWHGSGDLQGVFHLEKICNVAERTPKIKHWLPTQELGMVKKYVDGGGVIPANLVIRVSSVMIDDWRRRDWSNTSSVFRPPAPIDAHICPAPLQGHRCGECRACWSQDVAHVAYQLH